MCSGAFGLVGASSDAYLSGIIGEETATGWGICFERDEDASGEVIEAAILICVLVNVYYMDMHICGGEGRNEMGLKMESNSEKFEMV